MKSSVNFEEFYNTPTSPIFSLKNNSNDLTNCYIFSPQPLDEPLKNIEQIMGNTKKYEGEGNSYNNKNNLILSVLHPDFHNNTPLPVGTSILTYNTISADAVGFDINCGVAVVNLKISKDEFIKNKEEIMEKLRSKINVGIYNKSHNSNKQPEYDIKDICNNGLKNIIDKNEINDYTYFENNGSVRGDIRYVNQMALNRAEKCLKSVGSGNHYIEICYIDKIYNRDLENTDENFINENSLYKQKKDTVLAMIHTGSRGFGYEICTNYRKQYEKYQEYEKYHKTNHAKLSEIVHRNFLINFEGYFSKLYKKQFLNTTEAELNLEKCRNSIYRDYNTNNYIDTYLKNIKENEASTNLNYKLPEYISLNHNIGLKYIYAMNSAMNFAYANRYLLAHDVIDIFNSIYKVKGEILLDCSHNSASLENENFLDLYNKKFEYFYDFHNYKKIPGNSPENINNTKENFYVIHRKGSTKIVPPLLFDENSEFRKTGHPFVIGGSMDTGSIIAYSNNKCPYSLFSSCHGSGRIVPRNLANKIFKDMKDYTNKNIDIIATDKEIFQENGFCYRDINLIKKYLNETQCCDVRFGIKPLMVVKG